MLRFCRADFQEANKPCTCASGRSAPLFLRKPVAIGVAAATAAAFCISKADWIVRAPVESTAGNKD